MLYRPTIALILILFNFFLNPLFGQVYPPQQQLVFDAMPLTPKPGYLSPITDPTFGTTVIRVTDRAVFDTHNTNSKTVHKYSKNQPWNSDGTLIHMDGWPGAILDPQTFQVIDMIRPPGGPSTWSNTQPNIMYGTNTSQFGDNCINQLDVTTKTYSTVQCFSQYQSVSYGAWEGNLSNDDRYMALQCKKPGGAQEIACYDFVTNSIISTTNAPVWPNNVTMSQGGNYIMIQWDVYGTGMFEGTWIYTRGLSPIRNIDIQGGSHIDLGYDTQGNEVAVGTMGNNRRLRMKRLDNGTVTNLLSDAQMSWYIHVSCRNLDRPGYAYISEFEDPNSQKNKPYYQKIFAVKLDPNANDNALTETFAHTQHSTVDDYLREAHAVPNRDGSVVMFKSDWRGNASSEMNSYVAFMPGNQTCNLSCTASQTAPSTCGNSNGTATANPTGGTAPFSYVWSNGQTNATANNLSAGNYSVTVTDADNCTSVCSVSISGANSPTCTATQVTAPTCGNNDGVASVSVQGGTPPYSYLWTPSGQTTATANGLPEGSYTVVITDANNCSTSCTVTLTNSSSGGNVGAFSNVSTQNTVAWNAGNGNINRPKPALGVWEPGDVPGTEIMRVSDDAGNGLHFYNSRQVWNIDMTKMMIGDGVINDNRLLDVTNNYALLPTRIPLNSQRVWSNTNPDLIYGMQGQSNFCVFNVSTGVNTVLYSRPGGSRISMRSKGNLPGDDSKVALYEPSTNRVISFDLQTNTIIAEIVWPNGNIETGGGHVTYDWSGNWLIVGLGDGTGRMYRVNPNLTGITQVFNDVSHWDNAYNTNGESVRVQTRRNGSVQVVNYDDPSKNYASPIFSAGNPSINSLSPDYVSGRGQTGAPGWVALGGEPNAGSANFPICLYRVDGNTTTATIKVIGYDHHSNAPAASNGGNDDRQKPSVSPDGNQVIFTSDWGVPNGPLSSYILRGTGGGSTPCNLTCTASQTTAPSCGANNGQATVLATGGTAPYSSLWSDGQTTNIANGLNAGTYSVTVTDANNQTSVCSVTLTDQGAPTCTVVETTAPSCGGNSGVITANVQGGTAPFSYLWNDAQAQTTAAANGLPAGTYTVDITDANNCSTSCSITLVDPSGLSCSVVETTAPSPGGSNGVATVTATGGTVSTGDPRTDLLASPDRTGYGASATGGSNYVYVTNFNQLKNALQTSGNYVLLDASLAGQGIGFSGSINVASNTTLDGSLAPGSWLFPDFNAGYPANTSMFNHFSTTNIIIHSIELRGNRAVPRDNNHPSANGGACNIRGGTVWYDHMTITEFYGQSVMIAQGGDNITLSNMKIVGTGNGVWLKFEDYTPRHVSLFNSEIGAQQLAPYNEGASHFHMWNNYIHDSQYGASMAGVAQNNAPGQNGPVRTFSENNVFSNNGAAAEHGFTMGHNYGGPVQLPGFIYSTGAIYRNGDGATGNVINSGAPWTIPYSYTTMPANQVEGYVATNAGKIPVTGSVSYTYQWDSGHNGPVATGLAAGTYNVTVTDGVGCTTVCSVTMSGAAPITCNINLWLEGAFDNNAGNMRNSLQQIAVLPSGQPYNRPPWNYNGNEQSNYPAGSIDWVLLSLRTTDQASSEVGKGAGLLMQDGSIINASIELTGTAASQYYIVVEHRNHLPAMTPTPVALVNNSLTYDFRMSNSYVQGGFGQKAIGNQWVMYAGNIDQSSPIGYEITGADAILWQAANGNFGVYLAEDVNLDGDVNGLDRILLNGNNGISSAVKK